MLNKQQVIQERVEKAIVNILKTSYAFAPDWNEQQRREWYIKLLKREYKFSPLFDEELLNEELIMLETISIQNKVTKETNHRLASRNLYSFIILCGEIPKPWDWCDSEEFKGELGIYHERDKCYTLKRRSHSNVNIAKIDRIHD